MAADEKTGEADILFSQLSGNAAGGISPGDFIVSLFIRLQQVSLSGLTLSRWFVQNHRPEVQLEDLQCVTVASQIPESARPGASSNRFGESKLLL
jgi:hypothetical protein